MEYENISDTDNIEDLKNKVKKSIINNDYDNASRLYYEIKNKFRELPSDKKKELYKELVDLHKLIQSIKKDKNTIADPDILIEPNKKEQKWLKIGITGFDDLIDRGIPGGSSILVSGGPGSGKTTFCLQTLLYGASIGEKCLYMSFEESEERLKSHLKNYGYDPDKYEKSGNLVIKRLDPFQISRTVEALLAEARGELLISIDKTKGLIPEGFKPDRVVVDSLSAIAAAFAEKEEAYRIYIEQLFRSFERIGVTSFLISEAEVGTSRFSKTGVEEFLADGVIVFYNFQKGANRITAVEVVKIRGTSHVKKIVPFNFIQGIGMEVYPQQEIFL
jgi:KaiC/GvpD/RAD55 family RecA-like ATPase